MDAEVGIEEDEIGPPEGDGGEGEEDHEEMGGGEKNFDFDGA